MSNEETDVDLPVASEDKQTVVFCTKCGKEFDLYNELLEDHKFMCSSDFPNFEVKEKSHIKYIEKSDAEEAIKKARQQERQKILDKIEEKIRQLKASRSSKSGSSYRISELEELRDELEEEVEEA